jgi:hypothetical protein
MYLVFLDHFRADGGENNKVIHDWIEHALGKMTVVPYVSYPGYPENPRCWHRWKMRDEISEELVDLAADVAKQELAHRYSGCVGSA